MVKRSRKIEATKVLGEADGADFQKHRIIKSKQSGTKKGVRDPKSKRAGDHAIKSKVDQLISLLRGPKGVTVNQLAETLGWQKHSVRGAMSGALKKRGLAVASDKTKGQRLYRLAG